MRNHPSFRRPESKEKIINRLKKPFEGGDLGESFEEKLKEGEIIPTGRSQSSRKRSRGSTDSEKTEGKKSFSLQTNPKKPSNAKKSQLQNKIGTQKKKLSFLFLGCCLFGCVVFRHLHTT